MQAGLRHTSATSKPVVAAAALLAFTLLASCGGSGSGDSAAAAGSGLDARPSNTSCVAPARPHSGAAGDLEAARVFPNLSFELPVGLYQAPGDATRWFVIEQQSGLVKSFANDPAVATASTFLSLAGKVRTDDTELGLLGLAFHPQWPATPEAFVYYSVAGTGTVHNRISRFTSRDGGATLDASSEQVVLELVKNQSDRNHNGGNLAFGPDGYLYAGIGDGGNGGDPNNNAQNRNVLFGKMLRLDVNGSGAGYAVPPDNPFAGTPKCTSGSGSAACPEIFAYGLRNPWRWSFDRAGGALWVGDVGQDRIEEVDVVTKGANYGWNVREGGQCASGSSCATSGANGEPFVGPLFQYDHGVGIAVTGGYVYRGSAMPALVGRYVFADYATSRLFVVQPPGVLSAASPQALHVGDEMLTVPDNVSSFGQGNDGELYVVGYGGNLYKLQPATVGAADTIPTLLSQTGCVRTTDARQPAPGMIPYTVNAPFWSDGADKLRWLGVPDGTSITPQATARWTPPNGTVLMKHFKLGDRLVETRLLMRHPDGVWAGYTYEWNDAQTDATRVIGGKIKPLGAQDWIFPSETDCLTCHTQVAGRTLGLETAQLNGSFTYAATGRSANQIATLDAIGLLSPPITGDLGSLPALVDPHGTAGTVEQRARAFLHANCSQCHQPNGPTPVALDLRYTTALAQTGACNAAPTSGDLGLSNAKLIAPGAPDSSVLLARVNRRDADAMPPLGSNVVDDASVAVLRAWIQGLAGCQ